MNIFFPHACGITVMLKQTGLSKGGWMDGWMNVVLGHFYALSKLNWAGDNLG